jgi:hypothetical protein
MVEALPLSASLQRVSDLLRCPPPCYACDACSKCSARSPPVASVRPPHRLPPRLLIDTRGSPSVVVHILLGVVAPYCVCMNANLPCRDSIWSRRLGFGHRRFRRRPLEAPRQRPSTSYEASWLPATQGPQAPSLPHTGACRSWLSHLVWLLATPGSRLRYSPVATSMPRLFGNGRLPVGSPGRSHFPAGSPRLPHL